MGYVYLFLFQRCRLFYDANLTSSDFGDAYPNAQVRGVDLSPIQPAWIPPNVLFEIDDITQEWTYQPDHFDFIYLRSLEGCVKDWDAFFREAYKCCKPGGWVETFHSDLRAHSDDGSVRPGMAIVAMYDYLVDAGRRMGRPMDLLSQQTIMRSMRAAGFVDLQETNLKKPLTGSFGDRKTREIGGFQHAACMEGIEGRSFGMLALLFDTRAESNRVPVLSRFRVNTLTDWRSSLPTL